MCFFPFPMSLLSNRSSAHRFPNDPSVVTDCPPETGATSEAEGVDYTFPFSVFTFPFYSIPLNTSAFITSLITSRLVGSP